jgi:hypothetical protein
MARLLLIGVWGGLSARRWRWGNPDCGRAAETHAHHILAK